MIPDNTGKTYKKPDKELIKKLAYIMCTYEEIGHIIGMSGEGVKKRYKKIVEEGQAEGKKSLRRAQWEKALAGDTKMQIWLGRQYLGQKEDPNTLENNTPLPWNEDSE